MINFAKNMHGIGFISEDHLISLFLSHLSPTNVVAVLRLRRGERSEEHLLVPLGRAKREIREGFIYIGIRIILLSIEKPIERHIKHFTADIQFYTFAVC